MSALTPATVVKQGYLWKRGTAKENLLSSDRFVCTHSIYRWAYTNISLSQLYFILIIMINHWKVDVLCSTAANALFFVLGRRCAECQRLRCLIAIYIVWKYKIVLSFLLPLFFHLTALLYKWRCYCRVATVESPHGCVSTDVPFALQCTVLCDAQA